MKLSLIATVLALCLTYTSAFGLFGIPNHADEEAKKPCCTPPQWEGKAIMSFQAYYLGHVREVMEFMPKISLDFTNGKFAVDDMIFSRRGRYHVKTIADYSSSTAYITLPESKRCFKKRIAGTMQRGHCIPKNATYSGSWSLGLTKGGLPVDIWTVRRGGEENDTTLRFENEGGDWKAKDLDTEDEEDCPNCHRRFFMAGSMVTSKGCIPVQAFMASRGRIGRKQGSVQFHDITGGIKSPSVFTPPAYCKKDEYDQEDQIPTSDVASFFEERFAY